MQTDLIIDVLKHNLNSSEDIVNAYCCASNLVDVENVSGHSPMNKRKPGHANELTMPAALNKKKHKSVCEENSAHHRSQISTTNRLAQVDNLLQIWLTNFSSFGGCDQNRALSCLVSRCSLAQLRLLFTLVEPFFQKDFVVLLPLEISLHILSYLSPKDLLNASACCSRWREIAEEFPLWEQRCPDWLSWLKDSPSIAYRHVKDKEENIVEPVGLSPLYQRCPVKAAYLRRERVRRNWRHCISRNRVQLRGHDEHVITCLQVYNNGNTCVSGSDDNTLRIWTFDALCRGHCTHVLVGHTGGVWCSQVTDDGQFIISGSTDRTVRVWNAHTGTCEHTLLGHTSTVRCMVLCGDILVSGSRDATLRAWNIRTGVCLREFRGHHAAVRCVQFDGRRIVSGAYDHTVKIWNLEDRCCVHTLIGHTNRVYSLQFDSIHNLIVSGSLDSTVRVWNALNGACLFTLTGHQSLTSGLQLRGKLLISGNADSTLRVWNLESGNCLHILAGPNKHTSAVTSLQCLTDGLIATASDDGTVKLWDLKEGIFLRDMLQLPSCSTGGCIWRLKATPTRLFCAVGSRNGTEDTKLIVYDFDADCP